MIKLLSHLAHIEIATPDVQAAKRFYLEQVGLRVFAEQDGKVYLRAWGDYYDYSLVLSPGPEPALVVMAWRTTSAEALEEAARLVEAKGVRGSWREKSLGHGRSYTFTGPWGHTMELYWEADRFHGDGEDASIFPDRPERRSRHAVAPRQLDHITVAASDVRAFCEWYRDLLGFRVMAYTVLDEAPVTVFGVLTTNEKSHDLGVVLDGSTTAGRINHYAFWVDTREELLQGADILMENGVEIEYGPSIHGIGEQNFLYFRDSGGMRVEVNTGGYRNYVPDWEPSEWTPALGSNSIYRNGAMPMSMTESFPPADGPTATEEGVPPEAADVLLNPYAQQGRG